MKAYRLSSNNKDWAKLNDIEGVHTYVVSGVTCPRCGSWGGVGRIYPSVTIPLELRASLPPTPWPVSLSEFEVIAQKIKPLLGSDRLFSPGTDIGVFHGKGKGRFGDFAWGDPWNPFLRKSVWLAARERGFDLAGVEADIKFKNPGQEKLIELEVLPRVKISPSLIRERCDICGRTLIDPDDVLNPTLNSMTFDESIPLQRILEAPTKIIVNESLAEYIQECNLTDVELHPVAFD